MFVDSLNKEQYEKLVALIGNGVRPIRASKVLFPGMKSAVKATVLLRSYCWNKIVAYDDKLLFATRKEYAGIAARVWCDLPVWARSIPDDVLE